MSKVRCYGHKITKKHQIQFNEYVIVRRNIRSSKEVIKRGIIYFKKLIQKKNEIEKEYNKVTKIYNEYKNKYKGELL